jgi:acyl-CoA reductase-like NAD-dependent aldehyde dehydrogenase
VLINETNNYWDQLAPFAGMKKSGLGRELSDWILGELTEVKQISIDIAKVRFLRHGAGPPAPAPSGFRA